MSDPNFKDKVSEELRKLDEDANKPKPTPLDEEHLRRQVPPFHSDPDKVKEYHSFLVLRQIEICNWCDYRNPNFPVVKEEDQFNSVQTDPEMIERLEDEKMYGSYSGKRQQRVNEYFRARELGWSHQRILGIMGRWMNPVTLEGYKDVYDQWKRSKQEEARKK